MIQVPSFLKSGPHPCQPVISNGLSVLGQPWRPFPSIASGRMHPADSQSSTSLPTHGGRRACVFGVLLSLLMYLPLHFRRTCSRHQGTRAECKLCVQQRWPLTPLTCTIGYRDHWPFQHWTSALELAWNIAGTL